MGDTLHSKLQGTKSFLNFKEPKAINKKNEESIIFLCLTRCVLKNPKKSLNRKIHIEKEELLPSPDLFAEFQEMSRGRPKEAARWVTEAFSFAVLMGLFGTVALVPRVVLALVLLIFGRDWWGYWVFRRLSPI